MQRNKGSSRTAHQPRTHKGNLKATALRLPPVDRSLHISQPDQTEATCVRQVLLEMVVWGIARRSLTVDRSPVLLLQDSSHSLSQEPVDRQRRSAVAFPSMQAGRCRMGTAGLASNSSLRISHRIRRPIFRLSNNLLALGMVLRYTEIRVLVLLTVPDLVSNRRSETA